MNVWTLKNPSRVKQRPRSGRISQDRVFMIKHQEKSLVNRHNILTDNQFSVKVYVNLSVNKTEHM